MNDKLVGLERLKTFYSKLKINIDNKLDKTGNASNVTNTFIQNSTLSNLTSNEKLSVSLGKIMKAISDLISHIANKSNPHGITKSQIGLGNVDNTSDLSKPISQSVQSALNNKANMSHEHKWDDITMKPQSLEGIKVVDMVLPLPVDFDDWITNFDSADFKIFSVRTSGSGSFSRPSGMVSNPGTIISWTSYDGSRKAVYNQIAFCDGGGTSLDGNIIKGITLQIWMRQYYTASRNYSEWIKICGN